MIYDIYVSGKYFGNVNEKSLQLAAVKARQLINMSNPKTSATKFSLLQRVETIEFDL